MAGSYQTSKAAYSAGLVIRHPQPDVHFDRDRFIGRVSDPPPVRRELRLDLYEIRL